ncbi:hypothetical protein ACLOJK_021484 [Asimina triloba]
MSIVELEVHMDCDGCARMVRKAISKLEGVDSIDIDMDKQKVTVTGYIEQRKVLKAVRRTGRKAEFWPYPYDSQYHPYALQYLEDSTYSATYNYYRHGYNSTVQGYFPSPPYSTILDDDAAAVFSDENFITSYGGVILYPRRTGSPLLHTLESIVAGVPIICWQVNSHCVGHVWGIGLDMKDACERETVARMVRELMHGNLELRKSAAKMADLARKSVARGGWVVLYESGETD